MANLFELPRYIAVEGPIRVGKSTLARILAERLNAQQVMESEENPFLGAFYKGEPGAGFQAQFAFLIRRFEQLRALDLGSRSQKTVVTDFVFEKDKVFACLNLTDQELETYNRYYNYFREQLPTPDLVIYLQATPEVLKKRLKKKNAPGEKAINEDYLEEVIKAYEHFFFHYTSSDLLIVNTSEIDFVERNQDLQELLRKVSAPIKGTQYFLPLGSQEAASARKGESAAVRSLPSCILITPYSNFPLADSKSSYYNCNNVRRWRTMVELKVRKFGNSLGVVLPKEVIHRLRTEDGETTFSD